MPEVRQTIPYVQRLKYTIRPTSRFDPVRQNQDGSMSGYMNVDFPGIVLVVVRYLGNIALEPEAYDFKSRAFLESEYAKIKDIENPTPDQVTGINNLKVLLATHKLWMEDLLGLAKITDLEGDWAQAFSDALDAFPEWKEPDPASSDPTEAAMSQFKGLPVYLPQIRWDANLPWIGKKTVEVTIGIYKKADLSDKPTEHKLTFEDGASRREREAEITRKTADLAKCEALLPIIDELAALRILDNPDATQAARLVEIVEQFPMLQGQADLAEFKGRVEIDKANIERYLASLTSQSFGVLGSLLAHASVASNVQAMVLAAFELLKTSVIDWSELNMDVIKARYALPDVS